MLPVHSVRSGGHMRRPKQIWPLTWAALAAWLVSLMLSLDSAETVSDGELQSAVLTAWIERLMFSVGLLCAAGALSLYVLSAFHAWREGQLAASVAEGESDHYA